VIDRLLPAESLRPTWSSGSALVYVGGFVLVVATGALLDILSDLHGEAALTGYAALAAGLSLGVALLLQERDRAVPAGVAATLAVLFFGIFVAALLSLVGLFDSNDDGYQPATHLVEIAVVVAALLGIRRFRAPLLVLVIAVTFWITVVDVVSRLSWADAEEAVSLAVGAVLAVAGFLADRSARRPYGFWLHAVGGWAFGAAVLSLISGDAGWVLVGVLSLAYVALAYLLERSTYAVLGALGIVATTAYFAFDGFSIVTAFLPFGSGVFEEGFEPWQIALSFVAAGLLIALLGLVEDRVTALRRR
jgi:hypothetical protein